MAEAQTQESGCVRIAVLGDIACGKTLLVERMLEAIAGQLMGKQSSLGHASGSFGTACFPASATTSVLDTHRSNSACALAVHSLPILAPGEPVSSKWVTLLDCGGAMEDEDLSALTGYLQLCSGFIFVYDDFIPLSHQHLADRWLPLALEAVAGTQVPHPHRSAQARDTSSTPQSEHANLRKRSLLRDPPALPGDFPVFTVHNMRDRGRGRSYTPRANLATPSARSSTINLSRPPAAQLHCDVRTCGEADVGRVLSFLASVHGAAAHSSTMV